MNVFLITDRYIWYSICDYFGTTDGLTVDCNVAGKNGVLFLLCGVVTVRCHGEIFFFVVVDFGFNYFFILKMWWCLDILMCQVSSSTWIDLCFHECWI